MAVLEPQQDRLEVFSGVPGVLADEEKVGFDRTEIRFGKICLYLHSILRTESLLDIPTPGFVIEDSNRNPVFRVGCDGEVPELTLLHPHVPVSVDLLTAEPFLPGL